VHGIRLVGDGGLLPAPQLALGVTQDLEEQKTRLPTPRPCTISATEVGWYPFSAKRAVA